MRLLPVGFVCLLLWWPTSLSAQSQPIYPVPDNLSRTELLEATSVARAMSEAQLLALVPAQSGLHYVACPNCKNGRQENQLAWTVEQPDQVHCRFCKHSYPSSKYPMAESVKVKTPALGQAEYPYWADDNGYRHFFAAKRDDLAKQYVADQAHKLACLYQLTSDEAHARRALLILKRFADVFPNWCFHYDYPFRQKEIVDGPIKPGDYRPGYRTARWTWWAYSDIPIDLVKAYDWLQHSQALRELNRELNIDLKQHIEQNFLLPACQQVRDNPETYSNMSPRAWQGLTVAGRILQKPEYIHHVARSMHELVRRNFFYDGMWCEGSPDYEAQTIGGLKKIIDSLAGYADPPNYRDAVDGDRFDASSFGSLEKVFNAPRMLLPDGRSVPVHDTWPTSHRTPPQRNESRLWPGLGHACLAASTKNPFNPGDTQLHFTWSGGYGHSHADNLSLLLFHRGREVLSDLGYTHTAYRAWTLATAAHNTVVIDGRNQSLGGRTTPTDGRLLASQLGNQEFQYAIADGSRGYPEVAKQYRRAVFLISTPSLPPYIVDVFDVQGGRTHDYFLHGWADGPSRVSSPLEMKPLESLLPEAKNWKPPQNEGQTSWIAQPYYAYGFLNSLRSRSVQAREQVTVEFQCDRAERYPQSTLRAHLFPESNCELVLGHNPSIRQADEDDSRLDQFQRPFLMLRHNSSGTSRFLTVLEEIQYSPIISAIENHSTDNNTVLKISFEPSDAEPSRPSCQWLLLNVTEPVTLACLGESLTFTGDVGFLSYNVQEIQSLQCSGTSVWKKGESELARSRAYAGRALVLSGKALIIDSAEVPTAGQTIRLETEDGWVYPIVVQHSALTNGRAVVRADDLEGFEYDDTRQLLIGKMFPQRQHSGRVTVRW